MLCNPLATVRPLGAGQGNNTIYLILSYCAKSSARESCTKYYDFLVYIHGSGTETRNFGLPDSGKFSMDIL